MTAMPAAPTMTAREFADLRRGPRGWAWSLVEGELVVNEPAPGHQRLVLRIANALSTWIDLGPGRGTVYLPIDVFVDDRNVYAPDVLWYREGRDPAETDGPFAMPELAVEVRSPSTWRHDLGAKKAGYQRAGLPELWLVDDQASEVLVLRRSRQDGPAFDVSVKLGRGEALRSPLLPGFELPLERLFG